VPFGEIALCFWVSIATRMVHDVGTGLDFSTWQSGISGGNRHDLPNGSACE
jgi:hypothetical protein